MGSKVIKLEVTILIFIFIKCFALFGDAFFPWIQHSDCFEESNLLFCFCRCYMLETSSSTGLAGWRLAGGLVRVESCWVSVIGEE